MVRNKIPTTEQWDAYQEAWGWFNDELFDGQLEPCILNFSRKSKRNYGFFAPDKWSKDEQAVPEISLNPDQLKRPLGQVMGTLVHEMVHQWQDQCGSPFRNGYHNKEWGQKMKEVGLHPSNTGQPGGRETGQQVTHYVIEGGSFEKVFHAMPKEYGIPWTSGAAQIKPAPKKIESKVKFTCPGCMANAWGKPGLLIKCKPCDLEMVNGVKADPPTPAPQEVADVRNAAHEIPQGFERLGVIHSPDNRPAFKGWPDREHALWDRRGTPVGLGDEVAVRAGMKR